MSRKSNIATILVFIVTITVLGAAYFLIPDEELSFSERRKLQQLPEFSLEAFFSGEYANDAELYLADQFPWRDEFRTVKAISHFYIFHQLDCNGIYLTDGSVCKLEYPLKEDQVLFGAKKISGIYNQYLKGMNVSYAVVPDKSYYAAQANGYPFMDYDRLLELLRENVPKEIDYIDLFPLLALDSYYSTDSHWIQTSLFPVAEAVTDSFGVSEQLLPDSEYDKNTLSPFYGVYYGQSALPVSPDELIYLTSNATEKATVTSAEYLGDKPVYTLDRFGGMDGYDVFMSGAQAILTVENPEAATDRELIIFRDSYASSLTPLLVGTYSKITLVDLRYIYSELLPQYVEFKNQDVLFMYSTTLLNSSMLLK